MCGHSSLCLNDLRYWLRGHVVSLEEAIRCPTRTISSHINVYTYQMLFYENNDRSDVSCRSQPYSALSVAKLRTQALQLTLPLGIQHSLDASQAFYERTARPLPLSMHYANHKLAIATQGVSRTSFLRTNIVVERSRSSSQMQSRKST
jgi:hypothetical protein